jgi:hypothetical protein
VIFELVTAVLLAIHVFWNMALCRQVFLVLWVIAVPLF